VQCDEIKPQCVNCTKRDIHCGFLPRSSQTEVPRVNDAAGSSHPVQASPSTSSTRAHAADVSYEPDRTEGNSLPCYPRESLEGNSSLALDVEDFALLHHYTVSTSYTLAVVSGLQTFMRIDLPQIAFSNQFLLHGVLAIAALHLSRFKRDALEINLYTTKAMHHYGIALRHATLLMADIDVKNGPALYLFSMLCFTFTLGLGPKPGDFLLFGQNGIANWFVQTQGMKLLLETNPEIFHNETLSPLFAVSIRNMAQTHSGTDHLAELREQILRIAPNETELGTYLKALDRLSERFDRKTQGLQMFPQQVFVWLYQLEEDFVRLLQEKKPIALVILAYFCILLNGLGSFWWTRGWMQHLLSEIHHTLNQEYRIWMRRPMEETGWIAG
jgi:hypothetical protein